MAEGIVIFGLEKLLGLLNKEYELLEGVKDQVTELEKDLKMLIACLKDADAKKRTSSLVKNNVEEIKEITIHAEDIIEAYQLKKRRGIESGIMKHMKSRACFLVDSRQISLEITKISNRIDKMVQVMQIPGIEAITIDDGYAQPLHEIGWETRHMSPHVYCWKHKRDHVGLGTNVEILVSNLVDNDDVQVVSITGMEGIGKTTLARHVFNHKRVGERFEGFVWVCVSQQFTRQYALETILQSLRPEYKGLMMTEEKLQAKILELLETHIALIVLDDMCEEKDWDKIKDAFPPKKGWKILLTSCNKDVGLHIKKNLIFELQCLTDEDSWTLFQSIAFPTDETAEYRVDKEMVEKGKEMSKYCGGVPLTVEVLGGLLAAQYKLHEWKRVYESIGTIIMGRISFDEDRYSSVSKVLSLSFKELPSYLKHCFLYLAQYPEDCEINVEKLSYYWAAEGLLKPRPYNEIPNPRLEYETTIRDVANSCIRELVERNMVSAEIDNKTSRFETCQLHGLMREFCLSKAEEEKFVRIVNNQTSRSSTDFKSLRLAVPLSDRFDGDGKIQNPKLRSLLFIEGVKFLGLMETNVSFTMIRYLRVLDLTRARFKGGKLPSSIGKLIHLRYLSLYKADVAHLPSWLRNLKSLLYLNLDVYLLRSSATNENVEQPLYVPNIFKEMQELRYLCLPRKIHDKTKLELRNQVNLETLENFQTKNISVGDLEHMKELRNLSIFVNRGCSMKTLSSHLGSLRHLEKLIIGRMGDDAEDFVLKCDDLYQLELNIHMPKLPEVKDFPSRLTSITLSHCCLKEDPMPILEKLHQLKEVTLGTRAFVGKEMACSGNGFRQLQKLSLSDLEEWDEWTVEEGSMPLLQSLIICRCGNLKRLPDLGVINSLKELRLTVTESSVKEILERNREDYYKVRRIPIVQIWLDEKPRIMSVSNNRQPVETFLKRKYSNSIGRTSQEFLIRYSSRSRMGGSSSRRGTSGSQTPSTHVPKMPSATTPMQMSVEHFVSQPGREHMTRLHPQCVGRATWFQVPHNEISKFPHNEISRSIKRMLNGMIKQTYDKYLTMPLEDRNMWFQQFAQDFTWDKKHTPLVRREFDTKAELMYSRKINKWKDKWKHNEVPKEMAINPDLWKGFINYWKEEETDALSKTNSTNQMSDRKGKGIATHKLGATSKDSQEEQIFQIDGDHPSHLKLIEDSNTNRTTKEIQDQVSQDVVETVRKKREEYLLSQPVGEGTSSNEVPFDKSNKLVIEETPKNKSLIFVLPNEYQSRSSATLGFFGDSELRAELAEKTTEIQGLRDEIQTIREENAMQKTKMEAQIKAAIEAHKVEMEAHKASMEAFMAEFRVARGP